MKNSVHKRTDELPARLLPCLPGRSRDRGQTHRPPPPLPSRQAPPERLTTCSVLRAHDVREPRPFAHVSRLAQPPACGVFPPHAGEQQSARLPHCKQAQDAKSCWHFRGGLTGHSWAHANAASGPGYGRGLRPETMQAHRQRGHCCALWACHIHCQPARSSVFLSSFSSPSCGGPWGAVEGLAGAARFTPRELSHTAVDAGGTDRQKPV